MFLVGVVATDEDDLICDFAQYYHVLNWRGLPLKLSATLAFGLSPESRVMKRATGNKVDTETLLLAGCLDHLKLLCWQNTADAQKGKNAPASIVSALLQDKPEKSKIKKFRSGEDFEKELARLQGSE